MKTLKNFFVITLIIGGILSMSANVQSKEMTVSAAASLTDAFNELIAIFEKTHPDIKVNATYAASNPLLRQIVAGAPVDVFASADEGTMDKAVAEKVVDPATRKDFAANTLVLIVPKGSPKPDTLEDLTKFKKIAVGNPDSVPAGRYTRDALKQAKLWDKLQPNIIQGENVRQVLDYVAKGEVDAGFVYGTDASQRKDQVDLVRVVEGHDPVNYPIAIATTGSNRAAGEEFEKFILSPEGQEVLALYGFSKP